MKHSWMISSDLAPGDAKSRERDWPDIELHHIETADDPYFAMAFEALWSEFGAAGEIEEADVLRRRMHWNPAVLQNGYALAYRLMLLTSHGKFAAVRDHSAIVREGKAAVVVHLSHNLVAPEWRRTGLAGWMRALPVQTARTSLLVQGFPAHSPITLVGEMEHSERSQPSRTGRLKAYEKAGFLKIDPVRVNYLQPDFRPSKEIDAGGGPQPLPFSLIIRRVGREGETTISGQEIRFLVESLYGMYAAEFREKDMLPLFASLADYPGDNDEVRLFPPTANLP